MLAERASRGARTSSGSSRRTCSCANLFAQNKADATVWNLDEVQGRLGMEVDVLPLGDEVTRDLALRNSSAAIIGRTEGAKALSAVQDALDLSQVAQLQAEVLRGDRIPSY